MDFTPIIVAIDGYFYSFADLRKFSAPVRERELHALPLTVYVLAFRSSSVTLAGISEAVLLMGALNT